MGSDSTHWRTGTWGMTWSTRCAAVCAMRRAPHDGQNPRRLQLKATSLSWPQSPQRSRRKTVSLRPVMLVDASGFDPWWFLELIRAIPAKKRRSKDFREALQARMGPCLEFQGPDWDLPLLHAPFVSSWRRFANRRELAGCLGLAPTPYASGDSQIEQGISKAGNKRARALLVELAWSWLRLQPDSALTQWFNRRFAGAGKRMRRVGIVALARRLAIALWRYLQHGEIPAGAVLKPATT
jgi:hypothetical protein